jgi:hypothetical protein
MVNSRYLACAGLVAVLGLASVAQADEHWGIDATFADGGTLKGYIDFNTYGYVASYDLVTSAAGAFGGFDFTAGGGNISPSGGGPGATEVTLFGPSDDGDQLTLMVSKPFTTEISDNTLLTSTFECFGSYSCPTSGTVRYLSAPSTLAAPEPASWSMMLLGLGGVGAVLRRPRAPARA